MFIFRGWFMRTVKGVGIAIFALAAMPAQALPIGQKAMGFALPPREGVPMKLPEKGPRAFTLTSQQFAPQHGQVPAVMLPVEPDVIDAKTEMPLTTGTMTQEEAQLLLFIFGGGQ